MNEEENYDARIIAKLLNRSVWDRLLKGYIVVAIGVLVTLATAPLLISHYFVSRLEVFEYGLPFAWRNEGDPFMGPFFLPFFVLDVLFFAGIAYIILVALRRKRPRLATGAGEIFLLAIGYVIIASSYSVWLYTSPVPFIP